MSLSPYRKILFYVAGALLVILNELFGFGLDEAVYTEHVKSVVEVALLAITGFSVYQAKNGPLPEKPK